MKKLLILTTALGGLSLPAAADEITVMGWGGAYTASQVEAYHKPFNAATGTTVVSVDSDNPATPVKAPQRSARNPPHPGQNNRQQQ